MGGQPVPGRPGAAERLLLCDGCFQAAVGLLAGCQDGCTRGTGHDGLCLRDSPRSASGAARRAGSAKSRAPRCSTACPRWAKKATACGTCAPPAARKARSPSAQAAWDYWHAHGDGETPVPSQDNPKEAP